MLTKILSYIRDVKIEFTKIVFPKKQEWVSMSILVLIVVVISGSALYLVDSIFGILIGIII